MSYYGNRQSPYQKKAPHAINQTNFIIITVSCSLISDTRFEVSPSGFHARLIDTFKTISSRAYDGKSKKWNFNISDYSDVQKKARLLMPEVVFGELPTFILKTFQSLKLDPDVIDLSQIELQLRNQLMPFQEIGVCYGIERKGRCLIADEMGLGKTYQALAIASYYRTDWPLLIASPTNVKNNWLEQVLSLLPSVAAHDILCLNSAKDYVNDAKVVIVTYSIMESCIDLFIKHKFGVLILDESHILKNYKAKCTMAAQKLTSVAKRVVLLSGTPALSRPSELYTQLEMLDKYFFGNFKEYSKRYCDGKQNTFGWTAMGSSNLTELNLLLNRKFMIRRTKDEVYKQLGCIKRESIVLDSVLINQSVHDEKQLSELAQQYSKTRNRDKHAALLSYYSETAKIKMKAVSNYITEQLACLDKFLVFGHHKVMLDELCSALSEKKVKFIRIDGNINSSERCKLVDKFQTRPKYQVAILSITAANAGITLTAAKTVIFAELHWTPSILAQAESRCHRIGQTELVTARYLLARGTADDVIWPMLQEKQDTLNRVGLCEENYGSASVEYRQNEGLTKQKENFKQFFMHTSSTTESGSSTSNCETARKKDTTVAQNPDSISMDMESLWGNDEEDNMLSSALDDILCDL